MATVKSLEDMLSSEVDESAVTALVGSLESQLASSSIQLSSQDVNTTSVTVNHVNNAVLVDNNVTRLLDGQKQGVIAASQAVSLINVGKPAIVSSPIADVNATSTATSNASNVIATLPGALPASGYITQVTGPSQQSFFSPIVSGSITVNRPTNSQEIKVVSQAVVSQINSTCTINTRSKTAAAAAAAMPNGSPNNVGLLTVRPNQTSSMGAIYDLANVASQQSPIVTSNACVTTTTPTSSQVQVTVANGKQITAIKSQADSKSSTEKNSKPLVITRSQESISVPNTVVQTTVMHQIAGTNVIQVSNPAVVSKCHVTTSQPVSVVSQVVTPSILSPGVQIVNVNPRLGVQSLTGQKTLAPRVMLATNPVRIAAAPQILTARAGVAGQRGLSQNNSQIKVQTYQQQRLAAPKSQIVGQKVIPCSTNKGTITLAPGMVRGAVLLKAENGQLQVVNIAGSSASTIPGTATYRLQSIPSGATNVRTVTPQQLVSVPVSATGLKANQVSVTVPQSIVGTIIQPGTTPLSDANSRLSSPSTTKSGVIKILKPNNRILQAGINGNLTTPLTVQTTTANNSQPGTPTQMSPNTAKKKCKNFLSTLIRLADEQPAAVARSVRNLIQGIIDGSMQAEEFTAKLQKELNSAPQPYLVPFLKKNLPYLRHSLITKELTIEGVRPPPPGAMILPHPTSNLQPIQIGQKRPVMQPTTQVRLMSGQTAPLAAQLLQQNQNIINQRYSVPRLPSTTQAKSLLVGKTIVASSVAASSPATVTALQSKFQAKIPVINSAKDPGKRTFSALRDDDDINDVAAMGGVNLIEESQKILASNSEIVGTQIRSCKDESFLFSSALQRKIHEIAQKHGIEDVSPDVINLVSHASQTRLKNLIEKLSVIAEHRVETPKNDGRYEVTQDVKSQIKFLEELDRLEKRRHEEQEREILLRAAKSRSKLEDPEQLKLKQKAKEMQRAELEELRQREANTTALLAIGPRKKIKLENNLSALNQASPGSYPGSSNNTSKFQAVRPRVKRVNIRDLLFLMEQEGETVRRPLIYKSYLK